MDTDDRTSPPEPDRVAVRGGPSRWVLLIHQIPPKPDYFRVKVWRRLQRLGAVAIKNSVYVLPRTEESMEDFQWQVREITAEGGEASVCEANFVDGLSDTAIEALFRTPREADYQSLIGEAKSLERRARPRRRAAGTVLHPSAGDLEKVRGRLAEIMAIDFFGAPSRRTAQEAVARLETQLSRSEARMPSTTMTRAPKGATWVTRTDVHVDRIASAWLIRRFIDPDARFKFVAPKGYRPLPGELRFDMFDAEYTHEGEACTFETLTHRFNLHQPALRIIGEIVHDIDYKESKFGRPEGAGVERMIRGIVRQHGEDMVRLTHGAALLDTLYEGLAELPGNRPEPTRPGAAKRVARGSKRKR